MSWTDHRLSLAYVLPERDLRDGSSQCRELRTLARALARDASVTLVFRRVLADTAGEPFAVAELEAGRGSVPPRPVRRALHRFVEERADSFDVVLEGSWTQSGKLTAWCARRGIPAIPVVDLLGAPSWLPLLETRGPWLAFASTGRHLRQAPVVLTATEELKRTLTAKWRLPLDRVTVCGRAVDRTLFTPGDQGAARRSLGLSPDHRILLAADGTDRAAADLTPVIEAVVRAGDPDLRLHVLGTGPRTAALQRLAGPGGPVVFHPPLSDALLATYLVAADLAISVDDHADPAFTAAEACCAGVPLAVAAAGALAPSTRGRPTGLVVEPDTLGWIRFLQRECPSRKMMRALGLAAASVLAPDTGSVASAYWAAIERCRPQEQRAAALV